jgi:putative tryptophan/tyrosine transport system substrate-binding protein
MGLLPLTLFFQAPRLAPRLLILGLAIIVLTSARAEAAEALSGKPARVGWVSLYPDPQVKTLLDAFRAGLAERGFVEGKNLEIITRSGDGFRERMPAVIEELVSLKPDVIVTHAAATFSARRVTTLPVVFGFSGDPIIAELTDSLARPSRNLTGISFMQVELNEKRLDLLHQIAPEAKTIILMGDPVHPGADLEVQASEKIASQLGIVVRWRPTRNSAAVQDLLAELNRTPRMPWWSFLMR